MKKQTKTAVSEYNYTSKQVKYVYEAATSRQTIYRASFGFGRSHLMLELFNEL